MLLILSLYYIIQMHCYEAIEHCCHLLHKYYRGIDKFKLHLHHTLASPPSVVCTSCVFNKCHNIDGQKDRLMDSGQKDKYVE